MNKKILYILILTISFLSVSAQNKEIISDTVSMDTNYANDIFYSMESGVVASVPRAGWDIAFFTKAMSAGIIINEGSGVVLYTYPVGDTASWNNVDTSGINSWNNLINNAKDWEDGAFNRNATGHPNYGWGVYNAVTHDVIGDSIYVISSPDAGLKKIWIVRKISVENTYVLKYANLDGSNEQNINIDVKPYVDKNFIYFSLNTNEVIDREPADVWDILFTKYIDVTFDSEGNPVDYLVTGATSNVNRDANKFYPVTDNFTDWASKPFETFKNVIGYNWKSFDMNTFSWVVEDSTVFFVKNEVGNVYKLVFTYWEGSSTGIFALNKEVVSLSSIANDVTKQHMVSVYPNPATNFVSISINSNTSFNGKIIVTDMSGGIIYNSTVNSLSNSTSVTLNTNKFKKGFYLISVIGDKVSETEKLVIR